MLPGTILSLSLSLSPLPFSLDGLTDSQPVKVKLAESAKL